MLYLFVELDKWNGMKKKKFVLRLPGLEPGSNRWQRSILPLNHKRVTKFLYTIQVLNIPKLSNY